MMYMRVYIYPRSSVRLRSCRRCGSGALHLAYQHIIISKNRYIYISIYIYVYIYTYISTIIGSTLVMYSQMGVRSPSPCISSCLHMGTYIRLYMHIYKYIYPLSCVRLWTCTRRCGSGALHRVYHHI